MKIENPFCLIIAILQFAAFAWYYANKSPMLAWMMFIYGLSNLLFTCMKGL